MDVRLLCDGHFVEFTLHGSHARHISLSSAGGRTTSGSCEDVMARKFTRVEEGSRRLARGDGGLCRLEELGSCGRRLEKG